mgnify:CR=1 FL=1|tara:strand:- start:18233 stop:19294 length:1062 start_codon:yes stop_codon:yes gene_type:complete
MFSEILFKKKIKENFSNIFFRTEINKKNWDDVLEKSDYVKVDYVQDFLDYRLMYARQNSKIYDFSIIFFENNNPTAVWPLTITVDKKKKMETCTVDNFSTNLLRPNIVNNISINEKKKILEQSSKLLKFFADKLKIKNILTQFSTLDNQQDSLNWLQINYSRKNKIDYQLSEIYLKIDSTIDNIKKNFRKSYKPLITSNQKEFENGILVDKNDHIWNKFKQLHYESAGRITRSKQTWDIQYESLIKKNAFLVYLKKNQKFLGFAYFFHSKDECLYSVAANDRAEMTKNKYPLGHLIQFFAIKEMIRRSIKWYKLGEENLDLSSKIDQKNLNIIRFKKGFSSHELPAFNYTIKF